MSTYVIGDVHGCYKELRDMLNLLEFHPQKDKIIFVGDLIGRGPQSVEVLDLVLDLGTAAINVLGNHELFFLKQVLNTFSVDDSLKPLIQSSKIEQYISYLSTAKLMHIDRDNNVVVTHAGIPPKWDIHTSIKYSAYFTNHIRQQGIKNTVDMITAPPPMRWSNSLTTREIIQYTAFGFTKMKYCFRDGSFDLKYQCKPGEQPTHLVPWYELRKAENNNGYQLIFGHWAALGLFQRYSVTCCDTGCVWGGNLTAIELTSPGNRIHQIKNKQNP